MSQASPPVGRKEHDDDRAAVLAKLREVGPCTLEELEQYLPTQRLRAMVHVHLFSLGDKGLVEWRDRSNGQRTVEAVAQ